MFKNKGVKTAEKPYVVEPKAINPSIHIVDCNCTHLFLNCFISKVDINGLGCQFFWNLRYHVF
jgi:hypothetical protein